MIYGKERNRLISLGMKLQKDIDISNTPSQKSFATAKKRVLKRKRNGQRKRKTSA